MSHVTQTPLSRSKDQRSRSPDRFIHSSVKASGSCSSEHGNVLSMGTSYCRRGRLGGTRRFGAHRGGRGTEAYYGGHPAKACLTQFKGNYCKKLFK